MSKALTLALALAAGRADAGALVVSALFGTEPPSYVHAAVANVLSFTLPSTKIVVHLSTASLAKPDSFTDPRIYINPDRQHTSSATGMVTRQHASNVRYAAQGNGEPFGDGDKVIDVAVAVVRYLARKAGFAEPSFAAAAGALRARNASVYYGFGSNATKKTRRQHNATLVRKKVPWYKRHGHANATLARRHRGIRHANATRLHHRRNHPRRHNPDGLGAPTPGGAADGVVVAAPAISSELEALAALHQKGALTDGEFAAAKAKLLG